MALTPQQHHNFQFNNDFWTHYAGRHPNDGVRAGFRGYNPQYRVPGTEFIIKRYHAGRSVGRPQVGLGVATPENKSIFYGGQGRVSPYVPALAQAAGVNPRDMRSSGLLTLYIDIDDRGNWDKAVDWLHEMFEIYLDILASPTNRV